MRTILYLLMFSLLLFLTSCNDEPQLVRVEREKVACENLGGKALIDHDWTGRYNVYCRGIK